MCVQDFFPLALAPSSFRQGNEAGKNRAGPLTSVPPPPSFGSTAGGSTVPLRGEGPGALRSQMGQKGPHSALARALRGLQCLLQVRWQLRGRSEQRGKHLASDLRGIPLAAWELQAFVGGPGRIMRMKGLVNTLLSAQNLL